MNDAGATLLEVLACTEFIAIVTHGPDGPHVVGTWGDYVRRLNPTVDTLVVPAGGYHALEKNLGSDDRIQLLMASRSVPGTHGPGQGCSVSGRARLVTVGHVADEAKAQFPWARGALVISVEAITVQL